MKTITSTFLLAVFLIHTVVAQPPQKDWDKRYGGAVSPAGPAEITSQIARYQSHYVICGSVNSDISGDVTEAIRDIGSKDYWVIKTDFSGNLIWDKRFGSNIIDVAYDLQPLGRCYYVVGTSSSDMGGDRTEPIIGLSGANDYWVIKMDTNRNKIWDKAYGSTGNEICYQIISLSDTRFLLFGRSRSNTGVHKSEDSRGLDDFWLVKIDTAGNKLWDKTIGGSDQELPHINTFIQTTPDSFLLGASSRSPISGEKTEANRGDYDYWVVLVDSNGVIAWDKTFGGSGTDFLYAVQKTLDGGYVLGGWSNSDISGDKIASNKGDYDYWVIKTDALGNKLWDRTYGGSGTERLYAIEIDFDGNIVLGGYTNTGAEGDKTEPSHGGNDIWLVKIDQNGNKIWDKAFGASGNDQLQSILVLATDTYILGGSSDSPADGDKSQPAWGSFDFWIIKTKPGDPFALRTLTLEAKSYPDHIRLNWTDSQTGNYVVLRLKSQNPTAWDTLGFTAKNTFTDYNPQNGTNFYQICRVENDTACLLSNIVQASFVRSAQSIQIYPNPAQDFVIISYQVKDQPDVSVEIYDALGALIHRLAVPKTGEYEIDTHKWAAGMYFLEIKDASGNSLHRSKLMIAK